MQLLTEVALGQESEELAAEIAAWANTGAMARFSRDDERQADSYAVKYLTATGYEPCGLITFFAKMRQILLGSPNWLFSFGEHFQAIVNVKSNTQFTLLAISWPRQA